MKSLNLDYIEAHKYTTDNKYYVEQSTECGCCYCLSKFKSDEVEYAVGSAMCPYCGVDAVVCDKVANITDKLLQDMNDKWFGY